MFKNIVTTSNKLLKIINFTIALGGLLTLSACIKNSDLVGYTFKSEDISKIKAGETSKSYIQNTLGTPSVTSNYGDNTWFYISTKYEVIAFFRPKIKEQKILAVTFNKQDIVADVKEYTEKDISRIKMVQDTTKTEGHDEGIINQLLGNVGRFNSDPTRPKNGKPK